MAEPVTDRATDRVADPVVDEVGVALLLVSHSADAARGTAEIARQMAPDVVVVAAGGTADGGLGTDLARVLEGARTGLVRGAVVVLADLGSAVMTAEAATEMLEPAEAARVRVVDAPFVEGAVAAAVAAQQGGALADVVAAAETAGRAFAASDGEASTSAVADGTARDEATGSSDEVKVTVVLRDVHGLHARPAAVLARIAARLPAAVRVGGVDAASMLELMRLDARQGTRLDVTASGQGAREAVDAVVGAMTDEGLAGRADD